MYMEARGCAVRGSTEGGALEDTPAVGRGSRHGAGIEALAVGSQTHKSQRKEERCRKRSRPEGAPVLLPQQQIVVLGVEQGKKRNRARRCVQCNIEPGVYQRGEWLRGLLVADTPSSYGDFAVVDACPVPRPALPSLAGSGFLAASGPPNPAPHPADEWAFVGLVHATTINYFVLNTDDPRHAPKPLQREGSVSGARGGLRLPAFG